MTTPEVDQRNPGRRARDEQIAAEPELAPLELPPDAAPSSVEAHLGRLRRRPLAEQFAEQRCSFLDKALENVKKWCVAPNTLVDGGRADQFWLRHFSSASETVTARGAHEFLVVFRLCIFVAWDEQAVANLIMEFRGRNVSDVPTEVALLAKQLNSCVVSGNKGQKTSAASKIALFTKPLQAVFIWDQHARKSVGFRDRRRYHDGGPKPRPFVHKGKHDYPTYAASCAKALEEERSRPDFQRALQGFRSYLQTVGGPMSESTYSPFVERRFFDKLMWEEGNWLKEQ